LKWPICRGILRALLLDKEKGVCYSGDAFGSGMVWLQVKPILPMSVYAGSCLRMKQIMESENINEIYCGHYPYVKKTYDINYITSMLDLANDLMEGNAPEPEPFNIKVSIGSNDPLIVTRREVSIVYDRDYIK
jgi:hydroxyacylglutathione hydrolase